MNIDTLAKRTGAVSDPTPDQLARGRDRFRAALGVTDSVPNTGTHDDARLAPVAGLAPVADLAAKRGRRRPARWRLGALTAAASAGLALVVVPVFQASPASAEAVLLAAAEAAGEQADLTGDAPYWHVVSESTYLGDHDREFHDPEPYRDEDWLGRDTPTIVRRESHASLPDGSGVVDRSLVRAESFGEPAHFRIGQDTLTWDDLAELPTDRVQLTELLSTDEVWGDDPEQWQRDQLFERATELLSAPVPPPVRRALWQVIAADPHVELLGARTDSQGRQGTAVIRDHPISNRYPVIYILDPVDGTLLEYEDLGGDGAVIYRYTFISAGPAWSAPAPQPPRCGTPDSLTGESC